MDWVTNPGSPSEGEVIHSEVKKLVFEFKDHRANAR
jgi:hypothetical protein